MTENTSRTGVYRQRWPSSNPLGIPDLKPELLWSPTKSFDLRVCGYSTLPSAEGCVFGYWTEDFRFAATWSKPLTMLDKLLQADLLAVVEPDHSTYDDDPLVEQLHAVYRTRWTGRFWQEHGLRVIPNASWTDLKSLDWSLLGIPARPPILAIEGRPRQRRSGEWQTIAAEVCRRLDPRAVLLYGATRAMADALPCQVRAFTSATPRNRMPVPVSQA